MELTQWSVSPPVFDNMQKQTQFILPCHLYCFKRFCGLEDSFPGRGRTSTTESGFVLLKKHNSFFGLERKECVLYWPFPKDEWALLSLLVNQVQAHVIPLTEVPASVAQSEPL